MAPGKIGLTKLNMPKTSMTMKKSAATSLSKTTSNSGIFHGVFAQRSLTGSGLHLNNKAFNSASISATRHALNDNRTIVNNNIGAMPHYHNAGNNTFNNIAAGLMAANVLTQLVAQGIDTFGGAKSTNASKTPSFDYSTTNTETSASISGMKEAKDSSTLRGAIETAEADKTQMQQDLTNLQTTIPALKQDADTATKQLEKLNTQVKEKEKAVSDNKDNVSQAKQSLESTKTNKESKLSTLESMKQAAGEAAQKHSDAVQNRVSAEGKLASAEATLASTPKTIPGPDGTQIENPAYQTAKNAVDQAKRDLETAKQQEADAKTAWDSAKNDQDAAQKNYDSAIKDFEKAEGQYKTAEEKLQKAEADLAQSEKKLKQLKDEQKTANDTVKKYEDAVKSEKELNSKIKDIDSEIKSQQKRLEKMEKKEASELQDVANKMNKLSDKIDKRNEEIDASDGLNRSESHKLKKNDKNSNEYSKLTERKAELQRNVNYTKLYRNPGETIGGKTFRTGSYDGETLYMIGSKKVTKEEYEAEKQKLQKEYVDYVPNGNTSINDPNNLA